MYWSNIVIEQISPPGRSKHAVAFANCGTTEGKEGKVDGSFLYMYGGKSGTFSLKDLWRLDLRGGTWVNLKPKEDDDEWPPPLQEHTMVYHNGKLYLFGGEIGMTDDFVTPLWIFNIKEHVWRKWNSEVTPRKGGQGLTPTGRRGHVASIYSNYMIIHGGYRDLKGSLGDLWAFHFDTESWHLFWKTSSSRYCWGTSSSTAPSPRHNHSAVQDGQFMYIYGGMNNLDEKSDCWKYDFLSRKWWSVKTKNGPGCLRGHVASKAVGSMFLLGGERGGRLVDEFWRLDFASESWDRLSFHSVRPKPTVFPACIMLPALVKVVQNNVTEERRVSTSSSTGNKYWWDDMATASSNSTRPLKNINIIRDFSNRINSRSSSAYQVLESAVVDECGVKNSISPVNETLRPIHEEKLIEIGDEDSMKCHAGPTKRSESVSSFQPAIKTQSSVRKSVSSVRFADFNVPDKDSYNSESGYLTTFPNSTSDYVSMEMMQDSSSTTKLCTRVNEFEMTCFSEDTQVADSQDNNVEVTTPNYLLLLGGQESHTGHLMKKQPLSIWRLRVTTDLFS